MPLPLEDHVRGSLETGQRGAKFFTAIHEAWSEFTDEYPERRLWTRKATSRNVFWERVITKLRAIASSDSTIEFVEHHDTVSLVIDDQILLRLKHADIELATRNVPTGQALDFDDHTVDLFGRTSLQRVRLCYILDDYETEIVWIGIAAHSKGRFLWKIELDDSGMVAAPARLPIDAPEIDTTQLVRIKTPAPNEEEAKSTDSGRL
ncbi:hypothetical protein ACQHGV_13580 [Sphingomonas pseudosanguinis]|uniref:hypothetical protein n=1 Tax=Sphingomonas pseudosanguinis TaxID=413712 RepID=UPI003F83F108